jgi:hypothetical protein
MSIPLEEYLRGTNMLYGEKDALLYCCMQFRETLCCGDQLPPIVTHVRKSVNGDPNVRNN